MPNSTLLSLQHSDVVSEVRNLELASLTFPCQNPAFSPMMIFCFMWALIINSRENSYVSRFSASRVTISQVYPPFVFSLVEGLFSPQQGLNHFPILSSNCTLFYSLSFYIFSHLGCQFRCPILCALKLTRIPKSQTPANHDTPNFEVKFHSQDKGQQWVTRMWASLMHGTSHRAYISLHMAPKGQKNQTLNPKNQTLNSKNSLRRTYSPGHSDQPTFIWDYLMNKINLTNTICI